MTTDEYEAACKELCGEMLNIVRDYYLKQTTRERDHCLAVLNCLAACSEHVLGGTDWDPEAVSFFEAARQAQRADMKAELGTGGFRFPFGLKMDS